MDATLETGWIISTLLIATRIAAALFVTPLLSFEMLPGRIRLLLVVVLAWLLGLTGYSVVIDMPPSLAALLLYFVSEAAIGLLLAFGVQVAFAALMTAGRVLDYQMGFAVANIFDPSSQVQAPMMGTLLRMVGIAFLLAAGGHHVFIEGLSVSLTAIPAGSSLLMQPVEVAVVQFGSVFVYGLVLVAPAVFGLLLLDIAIAVTARTMPQVNVYFVSLPAKVFVGLLLTALSMRHLGPTLSTLFYGRFEEWQGIMS